MPFFNDYFFVVVNEFRGVDVIEVFISVVCHSMNLEKIVGLC